MYLQSSIREAYSMNKAQLWADLKDRIAYPPLSKWTRDELVVAWLERYGVKELLPSAMGWGPAYERKS